MNSWFKNIVLIMYVVSEGEEWNEWWEVGAKREAGKEAI